MWTSVTIAGKTAEVYEPDSLPPPPRFGVLYLHDEDGNPLGDQPAFTKVLDELKLVCVCPHGGRAWWTDRVCREFDANLSAERHVLEGVLPWFGERWGLQPRAIGLLGIGMGGQGALRLAFKHAQRFPVVAAVAPSIEYHELYHGGTPIDDMYDSKEQCRQDIALMHAPPYNPPPHIFFCSDPTDRQWYRGNDRLHEKLNALGIPHTADLTTRAGGHTWDYYNHMAERAIRFLLAGLEHESRRLL